MFAAGGERRRASCHQDRRLPTTEVRVSRVAQAVDVSGVAWRGVAMRSEPVRVLVTALREERESLVTAQPASLFPESAAEFANTATPSPNTTNTPFNHALCRRSTRKRLLDSLSHRPV
jgi:hypothetical protein